MILKPDEEPDGCGSSIEVGELMRSNSRPVATRVGVGWGRLEEQRGASIGQRTVHHIADIFTLYQCAQQAWLLGLNPHHSLGNARNLDATNIEVCPIPVPSDPTNVGDTTKHISRLEVKDVSTKYQEV